jgi:hypothetical protein
MSFSHQRYYHEGPIRLLLEGSIFLGYALFGLFNHWSSGEIEGAWVPFGWAFFFGSVWFGLRVRPALHAMRVNKRLKDCMPFDSPASLHYELTRDGGHQVPSLSTVEQFIGARQATIGLGEEHFSAFAHAYDDAHLRRNDHKYPKRTQALWEIYRDWRTDCYDFPERVRDDFDNLRLKFANHVLDAE